MPKLTNSIIAIVLVNARRPSFLGVLREVCMRRTTRNFTILKVALFPSLLSVLAIVGFSMLELVDEQHRELAKIVHHGLVMLVIFATFYLVGQLIRELGADEQDDDI
jgi:hypothetical protein